MLGMLGEMAIQRNDGWEEKEYGQAKNLKKENHKRFQKEIGTATIIIDRLSRCM
jgi:hypothetical protein